MFSGIRAGASEYRSNQWLAIGVNGISLIVVAVHDWQNAIVLTVMAAIVAGSTRQLCGVTAVLLFTVSFPPFSWPTSWFCLGPMVWLWRDHGVKHSRFRVGVEAIAIGFAMGWISTGFIRAGLPAFAELVHAAASLVFSLKFLAVAVAIRLLKNQPVVVAAVTTAGVAVVGEILEAWCGVSWSVSNFALTVAATPLAQWSRWLTPFGVAGLLYFINFLLILNRSPSFVRKSIGPIVAAGVLSVAWFGGILIAANTPVASLPFSAMLVQPHLKFSENEPWQPWLDLNELTKESLLQKPDVDLIVWPESCLSESQSENPAPVNNNMAIQLTVQDFSKLLTPVYHTNSLVGVVVNELGTTQRYGLEVIEVRRFNSGCLVSKSGEICRHDKLDLVPFKEGLPGLLNTKWIRDRILPGLKFQRQLAYGRTYAPALFRDSEGKQHSIAVAVCYESLLPWLPQYRESPTVDAIIHLVYDGNTADHPGMIQRQIHACQLRAIETRKWNLVCSTWAGTAIIDPKGKIVRQLPTVAGVLRTDM